MEKIERWVDCENDSRSIEMAEWADGIYSAADVARLTTDTRQFTRIYLINADKHDKEQARCCGNCKWWDFWKQWGDMKGVGHKCCDAEFPTELSMATFDRCGKDFCCKFHEWTEESK